MYKFADERCVIIYENENYSIMILKTKYNKQRIKIRIAPIRRATKSSHAERQRDRRYH